MNPKATEGAVKFFGTTNLSTSPSRLHRDDLQTLLDATERFEAAQTAVRMAETRIACFAPSAPLRYKVEATERLRAADAELAKARAAYDAAQDLLAPED